MKFRLATPIREVLWCFTQEKIVAHTEDLSTELSNIFPMDFTLWHVKVIVASVSNPSCRPAPYISPWRPLTASQIGGNLGYLIPPA